MRNFIMRLINTLIAVFFVFSSAFLFGAEKSPNVEVDTSALSKIYNFMKEMKAGKSKDELSKELDLILDSKPYQYMFIHYNRQDRPNELPRDVFKRMILSLRFQNEYKIGEKKRADEMIKHWRRYYDDLSMYEKDLAAFKRIDIDKVIKSAFPFVQSWLPPEMKIPDMFLFVLPDGGSSAYVAFGRELGQGYDFFQLAHDKNNEIDIDDLVTVVAHESHHLSLKDNVGISLKDFKKARDLLALDVASFFVGEGTANKFMSNLEGGCVTKIAQIRKTVRFPAATLKLWHDYTNGEDEMFKRFVSLFERAYAGKLTEEQFDKELSDYWQNSHKYPLPPYYFFGSELFGAIYLGLGKDACFEAIRDPRLIFDYYDKALEARKDILGNCPRIPKATVEHALRLGK
jgi:hypothetical protein